MEASNRCLLLFLLFGQLIAGVNQGRGSVTLLEKSIGNSHSFSTDGSKVLDFHRRMSIEQKIQKLKERNILPLSSRKREHSVISEYIPLCSPWDSCKSRCGEKPRGLPYTCNCDNQCSFYSDCCLDFQTECLANGSKSTDNDKPQRMSETKLACELLFNSLPAFVVSSCSTHYKGTVLEELCNTQIPIECTSTNFFHGYNESDVYQQCKDTVYMDCLKNFSSKCDEIVEPQCAIAVKKQCNKISVATCQRCNNNFWPVFSLDGHLYRNSYCAACNFENNYTVLNFHNVSEEFQAVNYSTWNTELSSKDIFRNCVPSLIDTCSDEYSYDNPLYTLCANGSGIVISTGETELKNVFYKNLYCAICNGKRLEELACPTWVLNSSKSAPFLHGMIQPLIVDFVTGDVQGLRLDDIPAAFSMLLNFGLDGRERIYISSEGEEQMRRDQKRCGKNYMWDPFSQICRKVHCSTEFVLVNYRCVKKNGLDTETNRRNGTTLIPDAKAEFVHLSLSAEMEVWDFLKFNGEDIDSIRENIRKSLSSSFNIRKERIRNVRFNISIGDFGDLNETIRFIEDEMDDSHPIIFTIDFDLYESLSVNVTDSGPSVDSIVSMLASALSVNGFELGINNVTSRIFEIHQTVDFLTSWCLPEHGGEQKEYWNSDFKLILNENASFSGGDKIKGIYINKTDKFYSKGQFVVDILYQGVQFEQKLINVSGMAIVCDRKAKLNESCPRVTLEKHEYSISDNGSLIIHNSSLSDNIVDDTVYEYAENESIFVCLRSPTTMEEDESYRIDMDIVQAYVSFVLSWVSVVAMAIVLLTYSLYSSLRNLPGCNTMNLTFSLLVMQVTFLLGQRNTVVGKACKVVAHILHYEILCSFMWMNIMAYDLYRTFGNKTLLNNIRSKGKYVPRYMAYAYGTPVMVIAITSLLDYFLDESLLSPHYGRNNVCWITSKCAAIAFFALPLALIMCINFYFYVMTILSIRNVKHVLYLSNEKSNQRGKSDVFLYARMALVIGLTWALAFAAAYVKQEKLTGQILTYLFIIFNTLQGVFIFIVFVCNHRVFELYRGSFRELMKKISKNSANGKASQTIFRIANAMKRSVSTDTVVSTVSNSSTISNDSTLKPIKEIE